MDLKDKLLPGYFYRNTPIPEESRIPGERYFAINTGHGGAALLIDSFREKGMPDDFIATQIQVFIDSHGWVALSDLTIKKVENDHSN